MARLTAFQETGSDKHLRDARGVLVMGWGEMDLAAMRRAARATGVLEAFEQLLEGARREVED